MCHSLFQSGLYHRGSPSVTAEQSSKIGEANGTTTSKLGPIHGILSHIFYVKDSADIRKIAEKKEDATAARKLYRKFLFYRYFVGLERPLIICEGKTDNVYLKCAIRKLDAFHPKLGSRSGKKFTSNVSFFSYTNQTHDILDLTGGVGDLKYLFLTYSRSLRAFNHKPLNHPVILLIDNDEGAKGIFSAIKEIVGTKITLKSSSPFFHLTDNLYLVKTPELGGLGLSKIENFFDAALTNTKLGGKTFNPTNASVADNEYGKHVFAEKVVRPNADKIDFSKFAQMLARIVAVIDHYKPPALTVAPQ
jgi:hypothetical protein